MIIKSPNLFNFWKIVISLLSITMVQNVKSSVNNNEHPILNLYTWYGVIPQDILDQFEQEHNIHINTDVYDSNEMLETKLLTGNSGYDVVSPSASYLQRQVDAHLYTPLDIKEISQDIALDPLIMDRLLHADPGHLYAIPFTWGLIGFAYNIEKVLTLSPDAPTDSWAMIYDPNVVKTLASCRVSVLEEGSEVITPLLLFTHMNLYHDSKSDYSLIMKRLQEIRPYISRFDALRSSDEIFSGQICLAMHWVGTLEYAKASQLSQHAQDNIKIVVPKEGTVLWIDALAIPRSAPHPGNAHKFIKFLLRPDIIARVTNHTFFANAVPASKKFIRSEIINNSNIYPDPSNFKKFSVNFPVSVQSHRLVNRMMIKFRMKRFD